MTGDLVAICRVVEAFLFRRDVCEIPTNSLTRFFASVTAMLGDGRVELSDPGAVVAALVKDYGAQRFPRDGEMEKPVLQKDVYHRRKVASFWLRRLENNGRKERAVLGDYTIEHVMPQNAEVSVAWREELGPDWQRIHRDLLHTIGNLTLTGYNSEYRDSPFAEKRDMENGFASSPLRLNATIGKSERWDEAAILGRGRDILAMTLRIWPRPSPSGRGGERSPKPVTGVFAGTAEELRAALAAEVRVLAPGFEEEVQNDVVAFADGLVFARLRAEGGGISVSLPLDAATLEDARRLTHQGRGQDGGPSTEIFLLSGEDVSYVAGLVFQSYQACLVNA